MSKTFAIFKNKKHIGNEKSNSKKKAIESYLKAAGFKNSINNYGFLKKYSAKIAINEIHHYLIKEPKK